MPSFENIASFETEPKSNFSPGNLTTLSSNQATHIQAKLSMGAPDDPYEREADQMADTVMRMIEPSFIQRQCATCDHDKINRKPLFSSISPIIQMKSENTASESVNQGIQAGKGSGSPLQNTSRSFMESRFGADFSNIRIHTGADSIQMNSELNAQAFTVGHDIYFNEGKYQPDSNHGKHLLAHELTHTIQQKGNIQTKIQRRTRSEALTFAQSLNTDNPGWLNVLPNCPCTHQETLDAPGVWYTSSSPFTQMFHPGATHDVRSVSGYTSAPGTSHGQQCTYDADGNLITEGAAAGTPDIQSPATNLSGHQTDDVQTFQMLGWRIYNQYWRPNNGNNCVDNAGGGSRMTSQGIYRVVATVNPGSGASYVPRTVTTAEDVQVTVTGRSSFNFWGLATRRLEAIPTNAAAVTLFGSNEPRFLPVNILQFIR